MSTQYINDWVLGLQFDASEVVSGINKVDKMMRRLNKINFAANELYQQQLNKQIRTLRQQERIVNRIRGKSGNTTFRVASGGGSGGGSRRPYIEPHLRPAREIDIYRARTVMSDFEARMQNRFPAGDAKAAPYLDKLNADLLVLKDRLRAVRTQGDLHRLRTEFTSLTRKSQEFGRELSRIRRKQTAFSFAAKGMADSIKNLARSYLSFFAVITAVLAAFRTMRQLDTIKAAFLAASGSVSQAAEDFEYVAQLSVKLGRNLTSMSDGWAQVAVAAKTAGLSIEDTKMVFEAAAEASTAFGLSADDTQGVLRAFTQMLSKGRVNAEELRQQLGDRLPVAVPLMAKALGLTTQQLDKMMEQGQVLSNEALPKFAVELRKAARAGGALEAGMNTVSAAQERMINSFTMAMNEMSEGGGKEGIVDIFNTISDAIKKTLPFWKGLGGLIKFLGASFKFIFEPVIKILSPVLNLLGGLLSMLGDLATMFDSNSEAYKKAWEDLTTYEKILRTIKDLIMTLTAPLRLVAELFDIVNSEISQFAKANKDNWAGALIRSLNHNQDTSQKMYKNMSADAVSRFIGGSYERLPVSNSKTSNQTINTTINVTSTKADPTEVRKEITDYFQNSLRSIAPAPG